MDPDEIHLQSEGKKVPLVIERSGKSSIKYCIFFAFLVVVGVSGESIVLPLWVDSGKPMNFTTLTKTDQSSYEPFLDNFFVIVIAAFMFELICAVCVAFRLVKARLANKTYDRRISHKLAILTGVFSGVAPVFIVFASNGTKTAPYLQAIISNVTIPATLILRYLILKKSPTKRKLLCSLAIIFSLFVCLLPSIFPGIDRKNAHNKEQGGATGWKGFLWPFIYILGLVFSSLANIASEKILQYQHTSSKTQVDLWYILFFVQLFQFITATTFFWADAVPVFGNVDSLKKVALNFRFGLRCTFGYARCSIYPALYGFLYVVFYVSDLIGSSCLLRYAEGATFLAMITAVVTPIGFLFWTLFKEQPSFHWHPAISTTVWLNIAGLVIMVPSIYLYNAEKVPEESQSKKNERNLETTPLLRESSSIT